MNIVPSWGLMIFAFSLPLSAADNNSAEQWEACIEKEQTTPKAINAEKNGGIVGLNEYLITRCGDRPLLKNATGKLSLAKEDCNQLFEFAEQGACEEADRAVYQDSIIKQLNPEAFEEGKYIAVCTKMNNGTVVSRSAFGKQVCGE